MGSKLDSLDEFYEAVEDCQVDNDEREDRFWNIAMVHKGNPEIMKGVISSLKQHRPERAGLILAKLQKLIQIFDAE